MSERSVSLQVINYIGEHATSIMSGHPCFLLRVIHMDVQLEDQTSCRKEEGSRDRDLLEETWLRSFVSR